MSEAKHTPGPWRVYGAQNGNYRIVYNESGNWLAEVFDDGEPIPGRVEADALLIAAAPEMLDALRQIVRWHGRRGGPSDDLLPIEDQDAEIADAICAIAKAEGRHE